MKLLSNSWLKYKDSGRFWTVYITSLLRYSTPKKILNALRTEYAYRRRISFVPSAPYILFLEHREHGGANLNKQQILGRSDSKVGMI